MDIPYTNNTWCVYLGAGRPPAAVQEIRYKPCETSSRRFRRLSCLTRALAARPRRRALLSLDAPPARAYHLRHHDGRREIDVVLEAADGRIVGLEIKAAAVPTRDDARHLRAGLPRAGR